MKFSVESNKTLKASLDNNAIAIIDNVETILMYITDALENNNFSNITCLNPFGEPINYSIEEIEDIGEFLRDLQTVFEITK